MQAIRIAAGFAFLALVPPHADASLILSSRSVESTKEVDSRQIGEALEAAEDADARELSAAMETAGSAVDRAAALLREVAAAPGNKSSATALAGKAAVHNATESKHPISSLRAANATVVLKAKNTSASLAHVSANATAKAATKNATSKDDELKSQLSILRDVYDNLKKGIARSNKHDEEGQKMDEDHIAKMEASLRRDGQMLNSSNLSDFKHELYVNKTRMDRAELAFWKAHREHQHGAFHSQLKLSHGMMQKVKGVTEIYESVLKGAKVDVKKLNAIIAPKIAALTQRSHGAVPSPARRHHS